MRKQIITKIHKQAGVTLLEVIIVIAIIAAASLATIQLYLTYRQDADVLQVKNNVDTLFNSMGNFYYGNCNTNTTLFPVYTGSALSVVPVTIEKLTTEGYLTTPIMQVYSIVAAFDPATSTAYSLMYIPFVDTKIASGSSVGTVVGYKIRIILNITPASKGDATAAASFGAMLGATCMANSLTSEADCSASTSGLYPVFDRYPSMTNPNSASANWLGLPNVKQFRNSNTVTTTFNCGG